MKIGSGLYIGQTGSMRLEGSLFVPGNATHDTRNGGSVEIDFVFAW